MKSPGERVADLSRTYGSYAKLGKSLSKTLGIKPETAAKYVSEIRRGTRDVTPQMNRALNRRLNYFKNEVPKRQIEKIADPLGKIEASIKLNTAIDISDLLPQGESIFSFNYEYDFYNSPKMELVRIAIEEGASIKVRIKTTAKDGSVSYSWGIISGENHVSQMYHISRRGYAKGGEESVLETFFELEDNRI